MLRGTGAFLWLLVASDALVVLVGAFVLVESVRFQRRARSKAPRVWERLAERPPLPFLFFPIPAPRYSWSAEARELEDPTLRAMAARLRGLQIFICVSLIAGSVAWILHVLAR